MLRKLLDLRVILVIVLVITWGAGGLLGYFYYNSNNEKLALKDAEIGQLNTSLEQIGQLVPAYTVAMDVDMGKKIEETDLLPIQVPLSMATNLLQDPAEIIGKHYKLDVKQGTPLTQDIIYEEELTDDMRLFDVVLHNIPVGLQVGSFVDVRIMLPLGEDFISLPHKKVVAINGGVLKLAVKENDIHAYNSMLVDSLLYPGTQLYATEYIEGGAQAPADSYYPISKNILAVAQKDPNLMSAIKSDILHRREALEDGLSSIDTVKDEDLNYILERGRDNILANMTEANRDYTVRMEKLEEERRQAEANAAANAVVETPAP